MRLPEEAESPSKRKIPTPEQQCVASIKFLCFKNAFDALYAKFLEKLEELYIEWAAKLKTDPGLRNGHRSRFLYERRKDLLILWNTIASIEKSRLVSAQPRYNQRPNHSFESNLVHPTLAANIEEKSFKRRSDSFFPSTDCGSDIKRSRQEVTSDFRDRSFGVDTVFDLSKSTITHTQTTTPDNSFDEVPNFQDAEFENSFNSDTGQLEKFPIPNVCNDTDIIAKLRASLRSVFPDKEMPRGFASAPLQARYEIVRVFLHTGVCLSLLKLPIRQPDWTSYSAVWGILKSQPALVNKEFPEQVSKQAWAACQTNFCQGSFGIRMSGSLLFSKNPDSALFDFRLAPLKLEKTHRLSRRFGSDRFLEIDMPSLTGWRIPKLLASTGPRGKTTVIEWLGEMHCLFNRVWSLFTSKAIDRKGKDVDKMLPNRIYFFAIEGDGFKENGLGRQLVTPNENETVNTRTSWSVPALLDWIRPTWENQDEQALKLYARTELALSRNTATIELKWSQIRPIKNDLRSAKGQIMTDGGGRLSKALALRITEYLGLSHAPCGFQARLGGAKGFWVVDIQDHGIDEWIEVYPKQSKWHRKGTINDVDYRDPAHRVFEVNKFSGKLKAANLNLQLLPVLMHGAIDKSIMAEAISGLLEQALTKQINEQRIAMENPKSFRKWICDSNNPLPDRLKHGSVRYRCGMPDSLCEKINILLDAGFDPLKMDRLRSLVRKAYEQHCETLKKKMNIKVERSTYAFMVPDWTGTLEEGEVYFHSSENWVDELSFSAGVPLRGELLVARLPAHFPSDIQKVKAVWKEELMGWRDLIVFPTKGVCLADQLSGGDYDGDLAWICWEPTIVHNFKNSKVSKHPNLVKEKLLVQDCTTYQALVQGKTNPTSVFLSHGLEFNLSQRMVGLCTVYKEHWCYTYKTISSKEATYLCKLLSDLVDQSKQGYTFSDEHFEKFKKAVLKRTTVTVPLYKSTNTPKPTNPHIIDRLAYIADRTIQKNLTAFHDSIPDVSSTQDEDLVALSNWAFKQAVDNAKWKVILKKLKDDIIEVKTRWFKVLGRVPFNPDETYEFFLGIQPAGDNEITRMLLASWHGYHELTQWALLKASYLVASYPAKAELPNLIWWVAGLQLCHIKALRCGGAVAITPQMYAMLKPDNTFVKLWLSDRDTDGDVNRDVMEREGLFEDCTGDDGDGYDDNE